MSKVVRTVVLIALGLISFLQAPAASAATQVVSGGILLGADDVVVEGSAYNVRFQEGTCIGIFAGCDSVNDFTFKSESAAIAASLALAGQVLVDTPSGNFASVTNLTFGCPTAPLGAFCYIYTPFGFLFGDLGGDPLSANVENGALVDGVGVNAGPFTYNSASDDFGVWAVWSRAVTDTGSGGGSVPLPGTLALMLIGIIGAARITRR